MNDDEPICQWCGEPAHPGECRIARNLREAENREGHWCDPHQRIEFDCPDCGALDIPTGHECEGVI